MSTKVFLLEKLVVERTKFFQFIVSLSATIFYLQHHQQQHHSNAQNRFVDVLFVIIPRFELGESSFRRKSWPSSHFVFIYSVLTIYYFLIIIVEDSITTKLVVFSDVSVAVALKAWKLRAWLVPFED